MACSHSEPFRSYLIQRPKDKTDPDPKFAIVVLHIWPLMFLSTLAHLTLLTCTAGLIGPYIFPALLLCFFADLAALLVNCYKRARRKEKEKKKDPTEHSHENNEFQTNLEQNTTSTHEGRPFPPRDEESYLLHSHDREFRLNMTDILIAALCSTWLPCAVGDQKQKIFLVSGMTSLITKVLILAVAVALALSGDEVQQQIYKRPFLLYCVDENSLLLTEEGVRQCSGLLSDCFANNNMTLANEVQLEDAFEQLNDAVENYQNVVSDIKRNNQSNEQGKVHNFIQKKLFDTSEFLNRIKQTKAELDVLLTSTRAGHIQQKLRVCQDGEGLFRIGLFLGLLVVIALAAYSTYRLHRIADYRVFKMEALLLFKYLPNWSPGTLQLVQDNSVVHTKPKVQGNTSLIADRGHRRRATAIAFDRRKAGEVFNDADTGSTKS